MNTNLNSYYPNPNSYPNPNRILTPRSAEENCERYLASRGGGGHVEENAYFQIRDLIVYAAPPDYAPPEGSSQMIR